MSDMSSNSLQQTIIGYHFDDEGHWVAQLACGHNQHVRHDPPMVHREWVLSSAGRDSMLGFQLQCKKCVETPSPAVALVPVDVD